MKLPVFAVAQSDCWTRGGYNAADFASYTNVP